MAATLNWQLENKPAQQVIGVGGGVQQPLHLSHPGQLLVESLPLLFRQSCASATGCKEDHASSSSGMVEETSGGGWDRGVGGGLE